MAEDELERRMRESERTVLRMEGKLDNIERQVIAMQKTLELFYEESRQKDETIQALLHRTLVIETVQANCKQLQSGVANFATGRLGNIVDWVVKIVALAAMAYALKEGFLK